MSSPIVIVGAGINGLLVARELSLAGKDVLVLEKGKVGQESSWAGGGILSPLYPWRYPESVNQMAEFGQTAYPALAEELRPFLDAECLRSGLLILDTDEQNQALAWASKKATRNLQIVDSAELQSIQPGVAQLNDRAIWMPDIGQVRNPRLVEALRLELQDRGVQFRENTEVSGFAVKAGQITGVQAADETISCDTVIVCGGAWTASLLASTGLKIPVEPVKGQILLFRAEPGLLSRMLMNRGRYLIPRKDGHILAGSTLEKAGFDKTTSEAARDDLFEAACEILPALRDVPVETQWAGLRPGSPDGVPFIGKHLAIQGLYINAGQYRNGLIMAPGSTRLLSDLVLGRPPLVDPAPYRPDRG